MFKYISLILPSLILAGNLNELIGLSTQNETLKALKIQIQSSKKQRGTIINSYLPNLEVGANLDTVLNENMMTPKISTSTYAKSSYIIYDGGKKDALLNEQTNLIDVAKYNYLNNENSLILETIKLYFAKLSTFANIEAKNQEIEQLKAELLRLEKFYKVGSASKDELEKIKARVSLSEADLAELDLSMQKLELNLEWLVGKKIEIEDGSNLKEPQDEESFSRADIKAEEANLKALKEVANAKKSAYLPIVKIEDTFSFYNYHYDNKPNFDLGLVDEQNKLSINLFWKIFDFGANKNSYEASILHYKAKYQSLIANEKKANLELNYAKKALNIAKTKINASETRVISADETYEAIKKKFRVGVVNNVVYLDALKDKFEAKAYLEMAKNDYEVKKAEYYYYAGLNIREYVK